TEICKLRLFLKLVAQVNPEEKIEPLPDIDFNIRAGNALVGFATDSQLDTSLNRLGHQEKKERHRRACRRSWEGIREVPPSAGAWRNWLSRRPCKAEGRGSQAPW